MMKLVDPTARSENGIHKGKETKTMSGAGAPATARNGIPALQIKLRQSGGVGGIRLVVALDGDMLRVIDRGQIRIERQVPMTVIRTFADRVRALERIQPKSSYGRHRYASDILTTQLDIVDDSNGLRMQVVSDPGDPAPHQFWELVNDLQSLSEQSKVY